MGQPDVESTERAVGAIVLAGGGGVRMGGADKASVELDGRTLLEHALAATAGMETVVAGDRVPTSRPVGFVREDPPGGGPAAAVLAALAGFPRRPRTVVVLAVDMPRVTARTVARLLEAAQGRDGALLRDDAGRRQHLCAAYDVARLSAYAGDPHGLAMRTLTADLDLAEVPALPGEADDVDTWADLLRLRGG